MNSTYRNDLFEQMYQSAIKQNEIQEKASKAYTEECDRFSALFYEVKQAGLLNEYLQWKRERKKDD